MPDILLIRRSKWCIVLQINSLSLFSFVVHTARHDNAVDFSLILVKLKIKSKDFEKQILVGILGKNMSENK